MPQFSVNIGENTKNLGQNWGKYQKIGSKLVKIPKISVNIGENTENLGQNW